MIRNEWYCEHGVGHPRAGERHHGGGIHGCCEGRCCQMSCAECGSPLDKCDADCSERRMRLISFISGLSRETIERLGGVSGKQESCERKEFKMPVAVHVVRSSEGTGLPARLRNLTIEQIQEIVVRKWRGHSVTKGDETTNKENQQ